MDCTEKTASDKAEPLVSSRGEGGRSAASRAQILASAAKLFREQGYVATTLRQIATEAGIQAGSIYYHFASKDDILIEVLDAGIASVFNAVRARVANLPPTATHRERIRAAVLGHLLGLLRHGDFSSASIRTYGQISVALKKRHRPIREDYARLWDEMIENAQKAGEIRADIPAKTMRLYLLGSLNWTVEWFNPRRGGVQALSENICDLVFDGISPEAGSLMKC